MMSIEQSADQSFNEILQFLYHLMTCNIEKIPINRLNEISQFLYQLTMFNVEKNADLITSNIEQNANQSF